MKILLLLISLSILNGVFGQDCKGSSLRIDCHPDQDASAEECASRGCEWCESEDEGIPWCYLPDNYGYRMIGTPNNTGNGYSVHLQRVSSISMFGGDIETLLFTATFDSNYRLRIKIEDANNARWEVPLHINPATGGNQNPLYEIYLSNDPVFSFRVTRKSSGFHLFDTSLGGFTFSDQFIQIAARLPSKNVYGLGENEQHSFRHQFSQKRKTWALFARDHYLENDANIYGTQPYYTVLEADGNVHSVAIVNSNAQEFEMMDNPGIVYRTIGGILDMYFFLGPEPEAVVQQFTQAIGRAAIPPYWSLGFQLCRWGYNNIETLKAAVERTAQYNIPQDVQYLDIDVMYEQMDFTVDFARFPGIQEYIEELHENGIKFMTILDPAIAANQEDYYTFDLGQEMDVWVKKPNGEPMVGRVWPGGNTWPVYFPDYSKNSTREWWKILIKEFKNLLDYDGLWIDMNEPANFDDGDSVEGCPNNLYNDPPFVPKIRGRPKIETMTLCMDHVHEAGLHYDTHSLYGWYQSEPTITAVQEATSSRGFVLSRSTFLGSGNWVGHWLGDNWSSWSNLYYSVIGMLQFNQFGIPFVGADICGFHLNTTAQMCQRWMELGAFYPFARNHNGLGNTEQDPGAFGPNVAASSREALLIRYTLLPYLYTLFYKHNIQGSTVARPLWHEFPKDTIAAGIDRQFLWGSGLLISPVLDEDATTVNAYFPDERFFSYYDGAEVGTRGDFETLDAPFHFIPLHLRGGNIIPTQEPALNTEASRNNPLGLIVVLDDDEKAVGNLYYDDGNMKDPVEKGAYYYATFFIQYGIFIGEVEIDGYPGMEEKSFETMRIIGAKNQITKVFINGVEHWNWERKTNEVLIKNMTIPANSRSFTISYSTLN